MGWGLCSRHQKRVQTGIPGTWQPTGYRNHLVPGSQIPAADLSGGSGRGKEVRSGLQEARHSQVTVSPTGNMCTGPGLGRCTGRSQVSAAHQHESAQHAAVPGSPLGGVSDDKISNNK